VESPDEIVKKRSRLPANKKCCDCSSKLPNNVNLSVGAFLCSPCAGIHRALPSAPRIKGVGHTVFTREEAEFLEGTDNEKINAVYLAGYNPSVERLRMPTDNTDLTLLRNWINRKYKDKAWYREDGSTASTGADPSRSAGGNTTGRGLAGTMRQPTVVTNIPPKSAVAGGAAAAAVDLFDSGAPLSTAANGGWDAFGTTTASNPSEAASFPADFGSSQLQSNTFGNFGGPQAPQPPQPPPQQSGFGNQAPQNFANFGAAEQVPQTTNNNAYGSFPATTTTAAAAGMQQGFPQQQGPAPTQNVGSSPNQNPPSQTTASFGNFPHQQQHQQHQQQQPPPAPQQQALPGSQQGGFGNFGAEPAPATQGFAPFDQGNVGQTPPSGTPQANTQSQFGNGASAVPPHQPTSQQPNAPSAATSATSATSLDKFDAFNSLSISTPSSTAVASSEGQGPSAENTASPKKAPKVQQVAAFSAGQKVYYKSASYCGDAEIVKVHFDDELEPFYTIKVQDKEKQTDEKHLDEFNPLQTEIRALLVNLSEDQLTKVKHFIFRLSGSQSSVSMNLSQAPSVPSLTSTSGMGTSQPPTSNAGNQGLPSTGVATTPVPQLSSSSTQSGAPVSPYINGTGATVFPSNQQQAQAPAVPSSTVGSSGQAFPIPQQQGANHHAGNTMTSAQAGATMGGAAMVPGGTDFGGIPSPVTDQKSSIPNPNGMPTAPMTSGPPPQPHHQQHQPQQQTQMPYNQQPQMQQVPPHGHMQYPPQMQQGQGQLAMPPQQMPQQAQFMHQQTPQGQGQIHPQMAQFPQHFPQQPPPPPHMAGQQFPQQQQQQFPQQQQQQFPQQQQQQFPQQQQQQFPQQQQQFPPRQQQFPQAQQQAPPSPMSPKGNPFDFY
jgi:Putative GTPase activating protein for Arf